ncbi:MAG: hypothetical protein K0R38_3965 [Polyangiaceae bacterium]|jgi:hypothetical protein|nr:hypothetical protein [Polyangiaceae bacterium]
MRPLVWLTGLTAALALAASARAEPLVVDRAVVRFYAPETGGVERPRFVYERRLAFEARLQAMADQDRSPDAPYRDRHVSAALERHISEVLLSSLRIEPEPPEAVVARQVELARKLLVDRVGGEDALLTAQRAESISNAELSGILRRQARASLYLDRMVAPMLRPSDAELEAIQRSAPVGLQNEPFARVRPLLLRWYVSKRLGAAMSSFYQEARSRVTITLL